MQVPRIKLSRLSLVALGAIGVSLVAACVPTAPPAQQQAAASTAAPKTMLKLKIGTATTPPPALPESTCGIL